MYVRSPLQCEQCECYRYVEKSYWGTGVHKGPRQCANFLWMSRGQCPTGYHRCTSLLVCARIKVYSGHTLSFFLSFFFLRLQTPSAHIPCVSTNF
jgi:hypothetical protein